MKVLEKTVTLGEKEFKIISNREIAVKTFEEFPEIIDFLREINKDVKSDDTKDFSKILKKKQLSKMLELNTRIAEVVEFALPLMLLAAKDNSKANDIIKYAQENNVLKDFNIAIFNLLSEAFTLREQDKPKVKFSIK